MTYFELQKQIEKSLKLENADFIAKQILFSALNCDSTDFIKIRNQTVSEKIVEVAEKMAKKCNEGVPLYYVLGKCEFYSLPFLVGKGVLVPRNDTEILVDEALKAIENKTNPKVLDLCSGSGAIAVAIAKNRPDSKVCAVELYDEAFCYLQKNISLNNANNVKAIKADALDFVGEYDLVVSNPPYISEAEKKDLAKQLFFEPEMALFADDDGLCFYKKIAENFKNNNGFTLIFEIGYKMEKSVTEILKNNGYSCISAVKDYGNNTRVIKAKI